MPPESIFVEYHSHDWEILVENGYITVEVLHIDSRRIAVMLYQKGN